MSNKLSFMVFPVIFSENAFFIEGFQKKEFCEFFK